MSGPDDPAANKGHPLTGPDDGNPASDPRPAVPDDDRFAAAFVAARGTVSPELDLNGMLDEPLITGQDGDTGHRRAGS